MDSLESGKIYRKIFHNSILIRQPVFRLVAFVMLILFISSPKLFSQNVQSRTVSLQVDDVTISTALVQLAVVANFNFSFNSDNMALNKRISYSAVDRPPLAILDDLLEGTGHRYKIVGSQVVIFKEEEEIQEKAEQAEEVIPLPQVITKYVPQLVYDTIFLTDTVYQVVMDTIYVVDTVFVEKEKPKKVQNKIKDIPVDYFDPKSSRESGWALGIAVSPIATDFSFVRQDDRVSIRSFSLGAEVSKIAKNWMFKGGIKFTNFSEKFNHNYLQQEGGYFVVDTVDEYYTVSQGDTSFFYVTDSSWKPSEIREYNYNVNNRIGLLELGLSVSYDFYTTDVARYYIMAGGQLGILVYRDGLAVPDPEQPEGINFDDLNFVNQSYSIMAGIGLKYRISSTIDFNTELSYLRYINNLVEDYPQDTKINGISLKLGILYYF